MRIKAEHPDDSQSILNDRVKGHLKVTRAFGVQDFSSRFVNYKLVMQPK